MSKIRFYSMDYKTFSLYLLAGLMAYLSFALQIPLFPNLDFAFGSAFFMMVAYRHGLVPSLLQAVAVFGLAMLTHAGITWMHVIEGVVLIVLIARWKKPLVATGVFVVAISPLILYLGFVTGHLEFDVHAKLGILVAGTNLLANAVLAELAIIWRRAHRKPSIREGKVDKPIKLTHLFVKLVVCATVLSILLLMVRESRILEKAVEREIDQITQKAAAVGQAYTMIPASDIRQLQLRNVVQIEIARQVIENMIPLAPSVFQAVLTDHQGELIRVGQADFPQEHIRLRILEGEKDAAWLAYWEEVPKGIPLFPGYALDRAGYEYDVPLGPFQLQIRWSLSGYGTLLLETFWSGIQNIILIVAVFGILVFIFVRPVLQSIQRLVQATTGIPAKLETGGQIQWPVSRYAEIQSMIANTRLVTEKLASMLNESKTMAASDPLTLLPNRRSFETRLAEYLAMAREQGKPIAVLFIDLDGFKQVNDTYGHDAGDMLLQRIASGLRERIGQSGFAARLGGDEFVAVLTLDRTATAKLAEDMLDWLDKPIIANDQVVSVSCSIGIAMAPMDGVDAGSLIKYADQAMYQAKEKGGRAYRFHSRVVEQAE